MTVVLQETLRAVFYTPFYAALALGAYAVEGVEVELVSAPNPDSAADGLLDGSVHITWGGPLRVIKLHDRIPDCDLVAFCEVVTRDPFSVVGRMPRPGFKMADLDGGPMIATVAEVPTPWLCLQEDLRRAGVEPARVNRIDDRPMAETIAMLRNREVDAVQLFEPYVEQLLAEGSGHLWYSAADRGPTSYTTLYARRSVIAARRDEIGRIVRAVYRTQKWLHGATAAEISEVVSGYFPTLAQVRLAASIERYKRLGIWGQNPRLPRSGFERLRAGIISGGFVSRAATYDQVVDNSFAEQAIRAHPLG